MIPKKNTYKHNHTGCRVKYQKVRIQTRGQTGVDVRQSAWRWALCSTVFVCLKLRTLLEIINKLHGLCLAMHILFARCALQFLCLTKLCFAGIMWENLSLLVRVYLLVKSFNLFIFFWLNYARNKPNGKYLNNSNSVHWRWVKNAMNPLLILLYIYMGFLHTVIVPCNTTHSRTWV